MIIVEDEKDIRDSVQQLLEYEGFTVSGAANGAEGLDLLAKIPHPCLILLDLMMPVMNGWQFAEALQSNAAYQSIPVVLMTAYADQAKQISNVGVIRKPFTLDVLMSHVKRHCHC